MWETKGVFPEVLRIVVLRIFILKTVKKPELSLPLFP
jgi:hypothetical protein